MECREFAKYRSLKTCTSSWIPLEFPAELTTPKKVRWSVELMIPEVNKVPLTSK